MWRVYCWWGFTLLGEVGVCVLRVFWVQVTDMPPFKVSVTSLSCWSMSVFRLHALTFVVWMCWRHVQSEGVDVVAWKFPRGWPTYVPWQQRIGVQQAGSQLEGGEG